MCVDSYKSGLEASLPHHNCFPFTTNEPQSWCNTWWKPPFINYIMIALSPRECKLRYIGCPLLQGPVCAEVPADDISGYLAHFTPIRVIFLLGTFSNQPQSVHNALYSFMVYHRKPRRTSSWYTRFTPYLPLFSLNIFSISNDISAFLSWTLFVFQFRSNT